MRPRADGIPGVWACRRLGGPCSPGQGLGVPGGLEGGEGGPVVSKRALRTLAKFDTPQLHQPTPLQKTPTLLALLCDASYHVTCCQHERNPGSLKTVMIPQLNMLG